MFDIVLDTLMLPIEREDAADIENGLGESALASQPNRCGFVSSPSRLLPTGGKMINGGRLTSVGGTYTQ